MVIRIVLSILFVGLLSFYCFINAKQDPHPQPHYLTKIAADGNSLSAWQGPWQCVMDSRTGLLWEVKTDSETIHDGYWSYSWFDGAQGVKNFGDCYFKKDRCDTNDLIESTNQKGLCGFNNWRLPTVKELSSLVDQNHKPGHQTIDLNFFPHTKGGDYWTSQSQAPLKGSFRHLREGAVAVNFLTGKSQALPYRNAAFVRLVTEWREVNK